MGSLRYQKMAGWLNLLKYRQAVGRLRYLVTRRDRLQNAGFLFFGKEIKGLVLAAFQLCDPCVEKIGDAALVFIAECHGNLHFWRRPVPESRRRWIGQTHYTAFG